MHTLRDDFPILKRTAHGKPLVYLDNAATTQKPQIVIDALKHFYEHTNANIHRGIHTLAEEATHQYETARDLVASFIHAKSREEIIFTRNTTESINLVAYAWGRENLYPGDEVIVSVMEHHSNFVPWQQLARDRGVVLKIIDIDHEGRLQLHGGQSSLASSFSNPTDIEMGPLDTLITDRTRLIAVSHASNVLGTVNDIGALVAMARTKGIIVLVDGAQAIPHLPVDVQSLGVDFYAFSAHKMMGPTGIGVLYGKKSLLESMRPFLTGGDMIKRVDFTHTDWNELPWRFEAGTPNIADAIAFGVAVEYITKIGFPLLQKHEHELGTYALACLSRVKGLRLLGPNDTRNRVGVFSFVLEGVHPHDCATLLDEEGIAVRSGSHCAHPLMARLGIMATTRISSYLYNNKDDIDLMLKGLEKAKKTFQ